MSSERPSFAPTRRAALALFSGAAVLPSVSFAATAQEVTWDDLIPPGVPYGEIIGEGELDEINDTWQPIFDENATKLNELLDGAYIKMPGYMIPMDFSAEGVKDFILVPYVGACIHVPPPPPNQLVFVNSAKPWPSDQLWDPVWVTGRMRTQLQSTELGETGYSLAADEIEIYEW